MPSQNDCSRFNRRINAINPNRQGFALNYFLNPDVLTLQLLYHTGEEDSELLIDTFLITGILGS